MLIESYFKSVHTIGTVVYFFMTTDNDKRIASIVRKELKSENYDDDCWLKAFKKADGDEQKAKAFYIDFRTNDLKKQTEKEKIADDLKTNSHVQCGRSFCVNRYQILLIPKKSIGVQLCEGCGNTLDQKVNEKSALRDIERQQSKTRENYTPTIIKTSTSNNPNSKKSKPMNFGEAISSCFKKYATFDGRASRSEFWYFFLFDVGGSIIVSFIHPAIYAIFVLVTLLPFIAAGCRRMHDVGRSGWFQCIPFVNIVWWCEQSDNSITNKF